MCPLFVSAVRSSRKPFFASVAASLLFGTVAVGAASPGAAFEQLPEAPVGLAFTLQMAASTAGMLSRITAIPEPASCLLFGTSVFGLLAIRRRLRRS